MSNSQRATIAKVAQEAGVSTATVSRVLNGSPSVSETTRQRVQDVVDDLRYRPSDLTRAVFAGRTNTIGVLFADMRSPYYVGLIEGISQVANSQGSLAYLAAGNRDVDQERQILSLLDSHRVRGLITAAHDNDDVILRMAESGTECVYITRVPSFDHPRVHSIRLDNAAAGALAWSHLADTGRTRVLVVNQAPLRLTAKERTEGFREAMRRSGVTHREMETFQLQSLSEPSLKLSARILESYERGKINAIFATTGVATFRAYEALARTGLRIPEDVAVLGVDDFQWAEHLSTPLSVITQPTFDMGMAAANLILEEPGTSQNLLFPPALIPRRSTLG